MKRLKYVLLSTLFLYSACGKTPGTKPIVPRPVVATNGSAAPSPTVSAATVNDAALILAAGKGSNEEIKRLLSQGANINGQDPNTGSTPLIEAVYGNHEATVKLLLEQGADPDRRKHDGTAALSFARKYPGIQAILKQAGARADFNPTLNPALLVAASQGDVPKLKQLLENGAIVNYADDSGRTALIEATYTGQIEAVKYLLEQHADPNQRKKDGTTALNFADKYPAIAELLRQHGAR